ncbi:hypothetical protein HOY80DRAFT_347736 [Tuber brumale]|nr:hypothetical protein HOY80DRAFT_347736 [Tuber brumale]
MVPRDHSKSHIKPPPQTLPKEYSIWFYQVGTSLAPESASGGNALLEIMDTARHAHDFMPLPIRISVICLFIIDICLSFVVRYLFIVRRPISAYCPNVVVRLASIYSSDIYPLSDIRSLFDICLPFGIYPSFRICLLFVFGSPCHPACLEPTRHVLRLCRRCSEHARHTRNHHRRPFVHYSLFGLMMCFGKAHPRQERGSTAAGRQRLKEAFISFCQHNELSGGRRKKGKMSEQGGKRESLWSLFA